MISRDDISQLLNDYGIFVQPAVIDGMFQHLDIFNNRSVATLMFTQCIANFDINRYGVHVDNSAAYNPMQPYIGAGPTQPSQRNLTANEVFQKDKIDMISRYLQEKNFTLEGLFPLDQRKSYMGKDAVDIMNFQPFVQNILLNAEEAQRFTDQYKIIGTDLVDYDKFNKDLNADKLNEFRKEEDGRVVLDALFMEVRKHVITKGLDLWSKFKEFDLDNNNYITPNELYGVLQSIGFLEVTPHQLEHIYKIFDQNGDQRISYYEFTKQFAEFNNKKCITDRQDITFNVFNELRRVMKQNRKTVPQIFGQTYDISNYGNPVYISRSDFLQVCQIHGIQVNNQAELKIFDILDTGHNQRIDITHLIDLVGFVEPEAPSTSATGFNPGNTGGFDKSNGFNNTHGNGVGGGFNAGGSMGGGVGGGGGLGGIGGGGEGSGKRMNATKVFYREFARILMIANITNKSLNMLFTREDTQMRQFLEIGDMRRVLESIDKESRFSRELLQSIAKEYDFNGDGKCFYQAFLQRMGKELDKEKTKEMLFEKLFKQIQFNSYRELYDLFRYIDSSQNRQFTYQSLDAIMKQQSIDLRPEQLGIIFEEYAWPDKNFFNFNEFQIDYQEFLQKGGTVYNVGGVLTNSNSPQKNFFNVPMILERLRNYAVQTGQHIRQVFKKTNTHADDYISAYDFNKILSDLSNNEIPQADIDRFSREIQAANGKVQFSELMRKYNQHFNIMDDDYELSFQRASINKIFWTIAQKVLDRNIKLDQVFNKYDHLESIHKQDFKKILMDRFQIHEISTDGHMNLACDTYTKQGDMVDHKRFLLDMEHFVTKQRQRSQILSRLAEHMTTKQMKLVEILRNSKSPTQMTDEFSKHQFYSALNSIGFNIDMESLEKVLNTFDMDQDGGVSYVEFAEAVERLDGTHNKTAKYFFNSYEECVTALAKEIEGRDKCDLGQYLADADVEDNGTVSRREFFEVVKAFKFGLGDGDIQAIMDKIEPTRRGNIPIKSFIEQVNPYIQNMSKKLHAVKSEDDDDYIQPLDDTVNTEPRKGQDGKFDPKFRPFIKLCEDIFKACIGRGSNPYDYFVLFVDKEQMVPRDQFIQAVDQLQLFAGKQEIAKLFDTMDQRRMQRVQLYNVDQTFRTVVDKSVQELKLGILDILYDNIERNSINFYSYFHDLDRTQSKVIPERDFSDFIKVGCRMNNINQNDFAFLVKQYDRNNDGYVAYEMVMKDLEDVAAKRGVNVTSQNQYASEGFGVGAMSQPNAATAGYQSNVQLSPRPGAGYQSTNDYTQGPNPYGQGGYSGKYDPYAKPSYTQPSYEDSSYSHQDSYSYKAPDTAGYQPYNTTNNPQYQSDSAAGGNYNQPPPHGGSGGGGGYTSGAGAGGYSHNTSGGAGNYNQPPGSYNTGGGYTGGATAVGGGGGYQGSSTVNDGTYRGGEDLPDDLDFDDSKQPGGGFQSHHNQYPNQPYNPTQQYTQQPYHPPGGQNPQPHFPTHGPEQTPSVAVQGSAKNTKQGLLPDMQRLQIKKSTATPDFLEAIMNMCYIKGKYVEEFFYSKGQRGFGGNQASLNYPDFRTAVKELGINIPEAQLRSEYEKLGGRENRALSAQEIDALVELGAVETVEDHQLKNLRTLFQIFQDRKIKYRQAMEVLDKNNQKRIPMGDLIKYIMTIDKQHIHSTQVELLGLRYTHGRSTYVEYEQLFDELDMIASGVDARLAKVKLFANHIFKTAFIHAVSIGEWVLKYNKNAHQVDLTTLLNVMQSSGVNKIFTNDQIQSYYKAINDRNQPTIDLRQFEQKLKSICPRDADEAVKKIILEQVQYSKKHSNQRFEISYIFSGYDKENKGVIHKQDFIRSLMKCKDLRFQEIDCEFLSVFFSLRTHQDMVEYKHFTQEFERVKLSIDTSNSSFDPSRDMGDMVPLSPKAGKEILLRKLGDAMKFNGKIIEAEFQNLDKLNSDMYCTDLQLKQTINAMKINFSDRDIDSLNKEYRNRQNGKTDYKQLIEDLKLAMDENQMAQHPVEIQKTYANLLRGIKSKGPQSEDKYIRSLYSRDSSNLGFLPVSEIKQSFTIDMQINISDKDLKNVIASTAQNSHGDVKYEKILELLFDQPRIDRVRAQMKGDHVPTASDTVKINAPVNAASQGLMQIGKRIQSMKIDLQQEFMELTKLKDFWIHETDFTAILHRYNYTISEHEKTEIAQISLRLQQDGKIDYRKLMNSLGLHFDNNRIIKTDVALDNSASNRSGNQSSLKRSQTTIPSKILDEKQRVHAQRILNSVAVDLRKQNKKYEQTIQKYRTPNDNCIPLLKFKMWLADECGGIGKKLSSDEPNIIIIYHYLKDDRDAINLDRLSTALKSGNTPMAQHNSQKIEEYQSDLMQGMNSGRLEIYNLVQHLKQRELNTRILFGSTQAVPNTIFQKKLEEYGFVCSPDQMSRLVEALQSKVKRNNIELTLLEKFITKSEGVKDVRGAMKNLSQFDDRVKQMLNIISDFFINRKINKEDLYVAMDANKDGTVDRQEFIDQFHKLGIPKIQKVDLEKLFDSLDINNDGDMSFNEFSLYLEGAKRSLVPQNALSEELMNEMKAQISELFKQVDNDGNGFIERLELQQALNRTTGRAIDMKDIEEMIQQVDKDKDGKIGPEEFFDLMYPKIRDDILSQEDRLEDLRAMFRESDLDHSGFLTVDEIYNVLLKMGAELKIEELVDLMNEIDVDRNGQLDIDEFIALMTIGEDAAFKSASSRTAMLNIRKARRLNVVDMFNCFKDLPSNFIDSFLASQYKQYKNLPSEGFKPQINPDTLLFTDILPYYPEKPPVTAVQKEAHPTLRPFETVIGGQILLEIATGIPISKKQDFERNNFVKRIVRVALFDKQKDDFIHNSGHVAASWRADVEDRWNFNTWSQVGTNPLVFKTADQDLNREDVSIIFEFVVYTKTSENQIKEQTCGWAEMPITDLKRKQTKKLKINGGTPKVRTSLDEINANRTGFKRIVKALTSKVQSQLTVQIRTMENFTAETRTHLEYLPRTCFMNKKIVPLGVGFRNYLGEILVQNRNDTQFKKPSGDFIVNTFTKALDCPDILEHLVKIYGEDVGEKLNAKTKKNIKYLVSKAKDTISRLYPLIHSQAFQYSEKDFYVPAVHDSLLTQKRAELISAALRHDVKEAKVKAKAPLESLTNFKPFNLRELKLDVYQNKGGKQDQYLQRFEHSGIRSPSASRAPSGINFNHPPSNQNQNPNHLTAPGGGQHLVPGSQQNSARSNQVNLSNQQNSAGSRGTSPRPIGSGRPPLQRAQ